MYYKKLKKITLLLVLFCTQIILANNLTISNVTKIGPNRLRFDISWDNSWEVSTYRDAAWVFIKYKNSSGQWQHLDLTGITQSNGVGYYFIYGNKGVMVTGGNTGVYTATGNITVQFDSSNLGPLPDFKVFGIEMVKVNQGAFYVGDGVSSLRFYRGDDSTQPYYVNNNSAITVGNAVNDINANYLSTNIPSSYPKGYNSFYMMKYEITQEQYAEFLNTLTFQQQQNRTESDLNNITASNRFVMTDSSSPTLRDGIACDANATNTFPITFYCDLNNNGIPNEADDGQNIVPTSLNVNDALAYLDWAALRPITDMEYEKATRGENVLPIGSDYANGTSLSVIAGSTINSGLANETVSNQGTDGLISYARYGQGPIRVGSLAFGTSTRLQSGAGFYGAMELTGNINELAVLTNNSNLSYTGNFGDGTLTNTGEQNEWSFNIVSLKGGHFNSGTVEPVSKTITINFQNFNVRYINYTSSPRGAR